MLKVLEVTQENQPIGFSEKIEAHHKGTLHRAFSILIFNLDGEMLLQKRADDKYHSMGKWSNAACGHPLTDDIKSEASQRLLEEMGVETELEYSYTFHYTENVGDLYENEIDEVYVGVYTGEVRPNPDEVSAYKWIGMEELYEDMQNNPDDYSRWFQIIIRDNKW